MTVFVDRLDGDDAHILEFFQGVAGLTLRNPRRLRERLDLYVPAPRPDVHVGREQSIYGFRIEREALILHDLYIEVREPEISVIPELHIFVRIHCAVLLPWSPKLLAVALIAAGRVHDV